MGYRKQEMGNMKKRGGETRQTGVCETRLMRDENKQGRNQIEIKSKMESWILARFRNSSGMVLELFQIVFWNDSRMCFVIVGSLLNTWHQYVLYVSANCIWQ